MNNDRTVDRERGGFMRAFVSLSFGSLVTLNKIQFTSEQFRVRHEQNLFSGISEYYLSLVVTEEGLRGSHDVLLVFFSS